MGFGTGFAKCNWLVFESFLVWHSRCSLLVFEGVLFLVLELIPELRSKWGNAARGVEVGPCSRNWFELIAQAGSVRA